MMKVVVVLLVLVALACVSQTEAGRWWNGAGRTLRRILMNKKSIDDAMSLANMEGSNFDARDLSDEELSAMLFEAMDDKE